MVVPETVIPKAPTVRADPDAMLRLVQAAAAVIVTVNPPSIIALSAATGAVTFSASAPAFNTVGSYCNIGTDAPGTSTHTITSGSNYSAGIGASQIYSHSISNTVDIAVNNLSGTWKFMGATATCGYSQSTYAIAVRVA